MFPYAATLITSQFAAWASLIVVHPLIKTVPTAPVPATPVTSLLSSISIATVPIAPVAETPVGLAVGVGVAFQLVQAALLGASL